MVSKLLLCCLLAFVAAESTFDDEYDDPVLNFDDPILKIVGGSVASRGQFPWQLHLKRNGAFTCGAVLISSNRALTAAHCLSSGTYTATAGEHSPSSTSGNEVTRTVSSWTRHPSYSTGSGYPNDIAILRFSSSFPSTTYIKTITMASSTSSDFTGVTCTISGWGRTSGGGSIPSTLRYANMPAISNSECASRWSSISGASINAGHICVYQSGKSACSGDSGGPMVCSGILAGITSWGISSCSGGYPSVYARVSYFRNWIDSNLN
ncbi:trypsin alpha-3-like [Liolophura sinensis]|uniref:trypsin alpha-3-like n=1 Tax=Liolophura sinensis TaxID=3198878 RepID=UPI003158DE69